MELTSKDRSKLSAMANNLDAIFQIGKGEISAGTITGISAALDARELVKITVLKSAETPTEELAQHLTAVLNAQLVRTIGNKIILYRKSTKKDIKHIL